jgi:hypothetical protein
VTEFQTTEFEYPTEKGAQSLPIRRDNPRIRKERTGWLALVIEAIFSRLAEIIAQLAGASWVT